MPHTNKSQTKITFSDKERLERAKEFVKECETLEADVTLAQNTSPHRAPDHILNLLAAAQTLSILFESKRRIRAKGAGAPRSENPTPAALRERKRRAEAKKRG